MPLERVPRVELKHADAAQVCVRCFCSVEGGIQVGSIGRAVEAADKLESGLPETVLAVEIRIASLEWVGR